MAVDVIASKKFAVTQGSNTLNVPYDSNIDLTKPNSNVDRAVVVIHGTSRNADDYANYIKTAADKAGDKQTAIIAPQFLLQEDVTKHNLPKSTLYWTNDGWKSGDDSLTNSGQPFAISSYEVLNRILLKLADSRAYPEIKEIVITGHSAGGQFVNRYAAGGTAQDDARQDLSWSYVIANPSSYMYFSDKRAAPGTTDKFQTPNVSSKSSYNDYKYGLEDLNKYMSAVGVTELKENYKERDVNILLGLKDTDISDPNLDTSAAANLQGDHRLERGQIYFNHVRDEFGPGITALHDIDYVPNVGHSGGSMFRSEAGLELLFGEEDSAPIPSAKSIVGNANNNRLVGGDGDNVIDGLAGNDTLIGGAGNDTLIGRTGTDSYDGGSGSDTVDFSYTASDQLRVDLAAGTAWFLNNPSLPVGSANRANTTEKLISIENVIGTRGDNFIFGDGKNNILDGRAGDDTLTGRAGNDTFIFGKGHDRDIIADFNVAGSDRVDVRGTDFNSITKFKALAGSGGNSNLIDLGDKGSGIVVSASGKALVIDFGDGDILTFANLTSLDADDFIFV